MLARFVSGLSAFAVTVVMLPVILHVAHKWNLYDASGPLKIHTRQVPRLGGIALVAGLLAGLLSGGVFRLYHAGVLLLVVLLVWAAGLVDDIRSLPPLVRLAVQLAAGGIFWLAGWSVPVITNKPFSFLCTCFFFATFVNAFNLLDGADGVAASVSLVIALGYVLLSGGEISAVGTILAASLAGCCIGFLIFNFPPARIFMGDSGSTVLGLSIAVLSLDFYGKTVLEGSHLVLPVLFAALPLLDLVLAILRRLRKGTSLFEGDRQHFYDLLLQRRWPARRVAAACALVTAMSVIAGYLAARQSAVISILIFALGIAPVVIIAIHLGSVRTTPVMDRKVSRAEVYIAAGASVPTVCINFPITNASPSVFSTTQT